MGNLIEKTTNTGTTQYTWNGDNKLTEVVLPSGDVIQYRYDAEGIRVKKVEGGSDVRYLMDGLAVLCEYEEGGGILREYVAGISLKDGENIYYYITGCFGNVRYVLNESGAVVQRYLYLERRNENK